LHPTIDRIRFKSLERTSGEPAAHLSAVAPPTGVSSREPAMEPAPRQPLHSYIERLRSRPVSPDTPIADTVLLVRACIEWGLSDSEVREVVDGREANATAPDVERAVRQFLMKHRGEHLHECESCLQAGCPNVPTWMDPEPVPAPPSTPHLTVVLPSARPAVSGTTASVRDTHDTEAWIAPRSLRGDRSLPAFPLDVFPPEIADYLGALALHHQVANDVTGAPALGVISAVVNGVVEVQVSATWITPTNIYGLLSLPSGESKTPVFNALLVDVTALEQRMQAEAAPLIREAEARREVLDARCRALLSKAKGAADPEAREILALQIQELRAETDAIDVPPWPQVIGGDCTPEGAVRLLDEQRGSAAIFSAEGGETIELFSRYAKDGKPNQGVFLHGYDGDGIQMKWATKPAVNIPGATLVVWLAVQPPVLHGMTATNKALGDRGLLNRFDYYLPESNVGYRDTRPPAVPTVLADAWADLIRRLGALHQCKIVIAMSLGALEAHANWAEEHEKRLRPSGDLGGEMAGWGNKLPGKVWRLAGLLHACRHPDDPSADQISGETMRNAIRLAEYQATHAKEAFALMGTDPDLEDADVVWRWLKSLPPGDRRRWRVTRREVQTARPTRFTRVDDADPALALLVEHGYLRRVEADRPHGPGRPPSTSFDVNPLMWGSAGEVS
jgi:hypothetical protein